MPTAQLPRIHFFRPGRYTALSGKSYEFAASDLAAAVAAYDPARYKAPIVVGHPKLDAPAFAWVGSISDEGGELYAEAIEVIPEFAALVKAGAYKKVSAAWFPPGHPASPMPEQYYLRHIGFLGGAAPALPGLRPVEFGADDDCLVIEFAYDDQVNAGLWRRLRDWFIGQHGQAVADQIIPSFEVSNLEIAATQEAAPAVPGPQFSTGDTPMTDEERARLADLEAKAAKLAQLEAAAAAQSAEFADREAALAAREAAAREAEIVEFADGLIAGGRVLPRDRAGLVAYLSGPDETGAIEFADGDETVKKLAHEWLRGFLASLPPQVDFAERGATEDEAAATAAFAAPDGYQVDAGALDTHRRALAWQQAHAGTDYLAAVKAVSKP